jgi:hypothetical protein
MCFPVGRAAHVTNLSRKIWFLKAECLNKTNSNILKTLMRICTKNLLSQAKGKSSYREASFLWQVLLVHVYGVYTVSSWQGTLFNRSCQLFNEEICSSVQPSRKTWKVFAQYSRTPLNLVYFEIRFWAVWCHRQFRLFFVLLEAVLNEKFGYSFMSRCLC